MVCGEDVVDVTVVDPEIMSGVDAVETVAGIEGKVTAWLDCPSIC